MIKVKKAKLKNIKDILRLKQELMMSLGAKQYKHSVVFKNVGTRKGKFYRLSHHLNHIERAFLWRLIGNYSWEKRRKVLRKKFKPIFTEFCKRYYFKKPDFDKTLRSLSRKGFVKADPEYISLNVPDEELLSVEDRISKELLLGHLAKKQKLEKPRIRSIYLLAEEKKKIYGYLWGYIIFFNTYSTAEIDELAIAQQMRGKGVGSKLINEFLKICKENQVSFVIVSTLKENKEAIRFYRKCGFKKEENVYLYQEILEKN